MHRNGHVRRTPSALEQALNQIRDPNVGTTTIYDRSCTKKNSHTTQ